MKEGDIINYCGEQWRVLCVEKAYFYFGWAARIQNTQTQEVCTIDDTFPYSKVSGEDLNKR
jgi:hypothetical protein